MGEGLVIGLAIVVGLVIAFLIGSIPGGVIVGKVMGGIDIRKHGSGNIGTTNSLRLLGWKGGALVCVLDILKGVCGGLVMLGIIHALGGAFAALQAGGASAQTVDLIVDWARGGALMLTTLGHMYSPFLKFKGGKGIATSFGGFCVLCPWCALASLVAFLLGCFLTKYVSIGSMAGAVGYLLCTIFVYNQHMPWIVVAVIVTAVVFYAHRGNIGRLARGEESRFSVGSKKTIEEAREKEQQGK
ncbi:MAG: glycerol-3-phosphate 1-O-acyltransferase PlsY [Coriobacteriales bacterium]|jgi:glycerol-3-phosphate acyltransferase PlsY